MSIITGRKIYKRDSKGLLRCWFMEQDGNLYRTTAGLDGGNLVTSEWSVAEPTNVGRSNERDGVAQAAFEVAAGYEHKLKREYFETPELASGEKRFFKPMLAEKWKDIGWEGSLKRLRDAGFEPTPGNIGIGVQPKYDGFASITQIDGSTSREGQPINSAPHINEALESFFAEHPEAVVQGELYNHDLKHEFEAISSVLKKKAPDAEQLAFSRKTVQLYIYDLADPNMAHLLYSQRYAVLKLRLAPFVAASNGMLVIAPFYHVFSDEELEARRVEFVLDGYEGEMVKLDIDGYKQGRSWQNLKNKVFDDTEFEIASIEQGNGNYRGYAKKARFWREGADRTVEPGTKAFEDATFGAGIKGGQSSFNAKLLADPSKQKVATVRYFGLTNSGVPRMGVVTKWHGEARTL
jgi:hypothetical protein